jgi:hypothetical protein
LDQLRPAEADEPRRRRGQSAASTTTGADRGLQRLAFDQRLCLRQRLVEDVLRFFAEDAQYVFVAFLGGLFVARGKWESRSPSRCFFATWLNRLADWAGSVYERAAAWLLRERRSAPS